MTNEPICGAVDEIDYGVWFECGLRPHHAGDHEDVHRWTNEPHGPKQWKPAHGWVQSLHQAYKQSAAQMLELALSGSPLVQRDKVLHASADQPFLRPNYIAAPVNGAPGEPITLMRREGGAT